MLGPTLGSLCALVLASSGDSLTPIYSGHWSSIPSLAWMSLRVEQDAHLWLVESKVFSGPLH
jgi:hypothetical protein